MRERRRVRAADDDVRVRVVLRGWSRASERDAAAVRGPARHAEEVGVELRDDLFDPRPREGGEVEDLDLVSRADRLRAERKSPYGVW